MAKRNPEVDLKRIFGQDMYIDDKNYVINTFHTAYLQKILMGNEKRPEFNFNF